MDEPAIRRKIEASFARQQLMATLGASIIEVAPGRVRVALPYAEALTQQHGYVHAAAITAVADTAGGYAALTLMEPDDEVLAVEFKINFVRPARGHRFVATGEVVTSGRTLTVCRSEVVSVSNGRETVVAVMTQTCIRVPPRPNGPTQPAG